MTLKELEKLAESGFGKPQFGDIVENGWASDGNPTKVMTYVRTIKTNGRVNRGTWWEVTDRRGKFCQIPSPDAKDSRTRIISRPAIAAKKREKELVEALSRMLGEFAPVSQNIAAVKARALLKDIEQ